MISTGQRRLAWLLTATVLLGAMAVNAILGLLQGLRLEYVAFQAVTGAMSLAAATGIVLCLVWQLAARTSVPPAPASAQRIVLSTVRVSGLVSSRSVAGKRRQGQCRTRPHRQRRDRARGQHRITRLARAAQRRVPEQQVGRLPRRRRDLQLGPIPLEQPSSSATVCGGSTTPSFSEMKPDCAT